MDRCNCVEHAVDMLYHAQMPAGFRGATTALPLAACAARSLIWTGCSTSRESVARCAPRPCIVVCCIRAGLDRRRDGVGRREPYLHTWASALTALALDRTDLRPRGLGSYLERDLLQAAETLPAANREALHIVARHILHHPTPELRHRTVRECHPHGQQAVAHRRAIMIVPKCGSSALLVIQGR